MVNSNFLLDFVHLSEFYVKDFATKAVAGIKKRRDTHIKSLN